MNFEFAAPTRIIFGNGTSAEVPRFATTLGTKAFLVTDSAERASTTFTILEAQGFSPVEFLVESEPNLALASLAMRFYAQSHCDFVIGMGGGSTLDTAKAVAALATNPGDIFDYVEIVGRGHPIQIPSAPFVAIPTTAGTGSEVTRNAVLTIPGERLKVSLRSPVMYPRLAVIDPKLTYSLPPALTASTGLDALTHCIEAFTCIEPNPMADIFCLEGIKRITRSLSLAYYSGDDSKAREEMALASMFGGLALANARLGAAHGLASVIGGFTSAAHGELCARLLPYAIEINHKALHERASNSPVQERYSIISHLLTGNNKTRARAGVEWLQSMLTEFNIPRLHSLGLSAEDIPQIASLALTTSSMKGNPVALLENELISILERAY
jgi:alcohol dehydrogenase class IV